MTTPTNREGVEKIDQKDFDLAKKIIEIAVKYSFDSSTKCLYEVADLLRTASLSATKKERDRILKIIVPGAIGNDGQMYKEIMETQ